VVTVGPLTVLVRVGPGTGTVSDTVVVSSGPETVVVLVGPATVTNPVVPGAVTVPLGGRGRVTVSPRTVRGGGRRGVVGVTMRGPPRFARSWVVQTASWSALPTAACAMTPIAPTPTR